MSTNQAAFPTTDWGLLQNIRGKDPELQRVGLEILAKRYWYPVYCFLRRFGHNESDSKDLTQAFFSGWIENDGFAKADSDKGRFRSFMLTCLKRFVSNSRRADNAQRRKPAKGLVSLDALMDSDKHAFEPQGEGLSPDRIFDRQWAVGVVMRVIRRLESESILGDVATFIVGVESQTQSRSNQASHPAERCAVDANSSVHES